MNEKQDKSGVVNTSLRLPRILHKKLKLYKKIKAPLMSINSIIIEKLEEALKNEGGAA